MFLKLTIKVVALFLGHPGTQVYGLLHCNIITPIVALKGTRRNKFLPATQYYTWVKRDMWTICLV